MLKALGVLLLVAFSFISPALAQTWIEFRPEGVGFSVEMPGAWKLTSGTVNTAFGPLKTNTAEVIVSQHVFITSFLIYPEQAIRAEPLDKMLDGARDGLVANAKGTLRSDERPTVNDLPAREIIIDAPNNLVVIARYFLLRNILVQALTAGARGAEAAADTRRFLNSLKVVSP